MKRLWFVVLLTVIACCLGTSTATADMGGGSAVCTPTPQYCTYAWVPIFWYSTQIVGEGDAVYQNQAYAVCARVRVINGANQIVGQKVDCAVGWVNPPFVDVNVVADYQPHACLHTWTHSWEQYWDGSTHADRYVASNDHCFR
jgi:hypothetical protein